MKFDSETVTVSEKLYFIYEKSTIDIKSHILHHLKQKDISNEEYADKIFNLAYKDDILLV